MSIVYGNYIKPNFKLFVEACIISEQELIQEKNYSYNIPEDKELLLYDFYMLTHLEALKKEGRFEPGDKLDPYGQQIQTATRSMGLRDSTEHSFEEIKKNVLDKLKPELLEASLFSIACELRHVTDQATNTKGAIEEQLGPVSSKIVFKFLYNYDKIKNIEAGKNPANTLSNLYNRRDRKNIKKYDIDKSKKGIRNDVNYIAAYKAAKKTIKDMGISSYEFADASKKSYDKLRWSSAYGGQAWSNICDAHMSLFKAKNDTDKIIFIDNMYHQQHNTGSMFNKMQNYYKQGFDWLKRALDFKADVRDNWQRIDKIKQVTGNKKRSIDMMYIEMLKAAGDKTWQEYYGVVAPDERKETDITNTKDDIEEIKKKNPSNDDGEMGEKFHELAQEGISKYPNAFSLGYIFVGKGNSASPIVDVLKKIIPDFTTEFLYGIFKSEEKTFTSHQMNTSGFNAGTNSNMIYFIKKELWKETFGPLNETPDEKKQTPEEIQYSKGLKESFIKLAENGKSKFPQNYKDGYIWIGKGSKEYPLKDQLVFVNDTLYPPLFWTKEDGEKNPTDGTGTGPSSDYFIKKQDWEKIFGKFDDSIKEPKLDVAKFEKYALAGYEMTVINKLNKRRIANNMEPLIYVGGGNMKVSLTQQLGIPSGYLFMVDSDAHGKPLVQYNQLGTLQTGHYFVLASRWEQIFGKKPPSNPNAPEKMHDAEKIYGKIKPAISHEDAVKYIKLAKIGYQNDDMNKVNKDLISKGHEPLIYIGAGVDEPKGLIAKLGIRVGELFRIDFTNHVGDKLNWAIYKQVLGAHKDQDYYVTPTTWKKIVGQLPPVNLNI